ncbi:MAG: hypothetical protein ACM30I_08225 [Gemmatimonas sp.]
MILYEIHRYRQGSWHLDSVYDSEELAIREAARVEQSHQVDAVRVVEVYDENNPARNRVVYRSGEVELRREAAPRSAVGEIQITTAQIAGIIAVGVVALAVWIYLYLH